MNNFTATISKIENSDDFSFVYFDFNGCELSMMSLNMADVLEIGQRVVLGIKSTAMALSKEKEFHSTISNHIRAEVEKITDAKLLSQVIVKTGESRLEIIVPKKDLQKLGINERDFVFVIFLSSELFVAESENV